MARSVQPATPAPSGCANDSIALAFVTTWSNAWQETYHRATMQVFEQWCRAAPEDLVVIPAAFGNTAANATVDDAELWLRPFSAQQVLSMSLVPKPEPLQQALFGNKRCDPTSCFALHPSNPPPTSSSGRPPLLRARKALPVCVRAALRPAVVGDAGHPRLPHDAADAHHLTPTLLAHPAAHTLFVTFVRREGGAAAEQPGRAGCCVRALVARRGHGARGCASRALPSLSAPGLWRARRRYGAPTCSSALTAPRW